MRNEKKQRVIIALIMILLIAAFIFVCVRAQLATAFRNADDRAQHYFNSITEMEKAKTDISKNLRQQHELTLIQLARSLGAYYDETLFRLTREAPADQVADLLKQVCDSYGAEMLMITDEKGKVIFGSREDLFGQNITECDLFTPEEFQHLTERGDTLVYAEDDFESWIIVGTEDSTSVYAPYIAPMQIDGERYYAIVLADLGKHWNSIDTMIQGDITLDTGSDDEFLIEILPDESCSPESAVFYCKYRGVDYSLQSFSALGFPEDLLKVGFSGVRRIGGNWYYCRTASIDFDGVDILVVYASVLSLILDLTPLILPAAVLLWFCLFMFTFKGSKRQLARIGALEKDLRGYYVRSLSGIALLGALLTFVTAFYMQSLSAISLTFYQTQPGQQTLFTEIENSHAMRKSANAASEESCVSQAKLFQAIIEGHPEQYFMDKDPDTYRTYAFTDADGRSVPVIDECGHPLRSLSEGGGLKLLCEDYGLQRLTLYNADGYTIADSSDEWFDRIERGSPETGMMFDVLDRRKNACFRVLNAEDGITQTCVPIDYYVRAVDGETVFVSEQEYQTYQQNKTGARVLRRQGLLVCEQALPEAMLDTETEVLNFVVSSREKVQNCKYIMTDTSDEHVLCYGGEETSAQNAADLGLPNTMFDGDYMGFIRYLGERYFAVSRLFNSESMGDMFIITLVKPSVLYGRRLHISLILFVAAAVLLGLMAVLLGLRRRAADHLLPMVTLPQNEKKEKLTISWNNLITIAFAVIAFVYLNGASMGDSMFHYILFGSWDRGVNVFSLSQLLFMLVELMLLSRLLRILERFFSLLSARGETLARLIVSAIKYGAGLFVIFYSLYMLGLDTTSVLRSLGAFSLIVGLGAQSLIKDIIAGIFVVFEGSYHVGDIVEINKFRGKVIEIALRTTKLESLEGNVMIFSNSAITNVENLSMRDSNVYCDLRLPLTIDPDEAKELILAELAGIRERNREIRGEIEFDGIVETNASGYVIRLIAHCRERDRGRLWRRLNREMIDLNRKLENH